MALLPATDQPYKSVHTPQLSSWKLGSTLSRTSIQNLFEIFWFKPVCHYKHSCQCRTTTFITLVFWHIWICQEVQNTWISFVAGRQIKLIWVEVPPETNSIRLSAAFHLVPHSFVFCLQEGETASSATPNSDHTSSSKDVQVGLRLEFCPQQLVKSLFLCLRPNYTHISASGRRTVGKHN